MFLQYLRENCKQALRNYYVPDFEALQVEYNQNSILELGKHKFYADMEIKKQGYIKELVALKNLPPKKVNLPENYKRRMFLNSEILLLNKRMGICHSFVGIELHADLRPSKVKTRYSVRPRELPENYNAQKDRFIQAIYRYCDAQKLDEVELYKKAHISKQIFSNIRSMAVTDYVPSKPTVVNLCLALKLNIKDTQELLAFAGYTLSPILPVDVIIAWCIEHDEFDIDEIALTLQELTGDAYLVNKLPK